MPPATAYDRALPRVLEWLHGLPLFSLEICQASSSLPPPPQSVP